MIGIEVHFSNWIAVDQCIDANFIVSRMKVLKRCDEPSKLKSMQKAKLIGVVGWSRNTLKQHFRALVERGTLNQHGSGRGVWYDLR